MKVLFTSAWYPNRYDSMAGLFVQKHAEAASLFCDVTVLYVHADDKIDRFEIVKNEHRNIHEYIVYFPNRQENSFYKIRKFLNYLKAYQLGLKELKNNGLRFDIIHANILTRTAAIAYLRFLVYKTPYVITEHWSRYLPEREQFNGFFRKLISRIAVKKAKAILPVSNNLENNMKRHNLLNDYYIVVNNVVDDFFYEKDVAAARTKKRIIHITCFDEKAKNTKGLLRAIKQLRELRDDFELQIIGAGIDFDEILAYFPTLNIPEGTVHFMGELPPKFVSDSLKNGDFSCLFSNYENVPVVISESLACGKPVVSTDVGGISEHINEKNGILISPGDEKELVAALNHMLNHFQDYNAEQIIAQAKEMYSFESVGRQLYNIYKMIE